MPPARRSLPAGRNSPGRAWAGPTASAICACSTNGARRSGSNTGSRRPHSRVNTISGRPLRPGGAAIGKRAIPGLAQAGLGPGARLRGLPQLLLGLDPARRLLRGRRQSVRHRPMSMARGYTEKLLGEWLTNRGVREQSVVIGKGAHTPLCYPDMIGKQLDAVARPAADRPCRRLFHASRQSRRAGRRIRRRDGPGGQGRPHPRAVRRLELDDGSAWTRRSPMPSGPASRGPARFPTISRWPKCWSRSGRAASPPRRDEWKAWLTARQMPNFAWSSQGRGFFTDRAGRDKTDNEELVRVWYSEKNFGRRDRAIELARQARQEPDPRRACLCAGAALPVHPADRPAHARRAGGQPKALDIELSPRDLAWLEGTSSRTFRTSARISE